jgi:hypothetical protein
MELQLPAAKAPKSHFVLLRLVPLPFISGDESLTFEATRLHTM